MQAGCRHLQHNQKEKYTVSSTDHNGYECYLLTLKHVYKSFFFLCLDNMNEILVCAGHFLTLAFHFAYY